MNLDEVDSAPLNESRHLLGRDVHDVAPTVFELDDLPFLTTLSTQDKLEDK